MFIDKGKYTILLLNIFNTKTPEMKKYFLSLAILAIVTGLVSCGSKSSSASFESDVKKMASYRCDLQKLMGGDLNDESTKKKLEDLRSEMEKYRDEMEKKYGDKKNDKDMNDKADKIMKEAMEKCK
jgi:hypothetical protein